MSEHRDSFQTHYLGLLAKDTKIEDQSPPQQVRCIYWRTIKVQSIGTRGRNEREGQALKYGIVFTITVSFLNAYRALNSKMDSRSLFLALHVEVMASPIYVFPHINEL